MPKIQINIPKLRQKKLFVATPMYGGNCTGTYAKSCVDLSALSVRYGVDITWYYIFNESLITRARNYLVDAFLRSDCTHLLFIDSDITFSAMDIMALLSLDKDIIGAPYPKKTIAWERIYGAVKHGFADGDPNKLRDFVGDYVFNPTKDTTELQLEQPQTVMEIGTGCMLVSRRVFEKFAEAFPERSYRPDHDRSSDFNGSREIHAYFDCVIDPDTKRYLSEDYMFCQWARKIGFEIWLCPWMKLEHTGTFVFGGSMRALGALTHKEREAHLAAEAAKAATLPVMDSTTEPTKE